MSTKRKKLTGILLSFAVAFVCAIFMMPQSVFGDVGDVPAHSKNLTDNHDGTYTLSLDVTGDADADVNANKANVVIVLDISGSMNFPSNTSGRTTATGTTIGRYAYTDGEYWRLFYNYNGSYYEEGTGPQANQRHGTVYYISNLNNNGTPRYTQYNGTRYNFTDNTTRMEATKKAVKNLVATLLAQNSGNVTDMIEISYVTFSSNAHYVIPTSASANGWVSGTSTTALDNAIDSTVAAGGTNWVQSLQYGDNLGDAKNDGDATYIVFFSDGEPTVGGNTYNTQADNIHNDGYSLYGIFAYGETAGQTRMNTLVSHGNYGDGQHASDVVGVQSFAASNEDEIDAAFAAIASQIASAVGIADAEIVDGTTNKVATSAGVTSLLNVDEDSYEYWLSWQMPQGSNKITMFIDGTEREYTVTQSGSNVNITWDGGSATYKGTITGNVVKIQWEEATDFYNYDPPEAELGEDGAVDWDLSDVGTLLDGVTYTVTFDVYPSQTALDYKARLQNGESYTSVVPAEARPYFDENGDLKTNTTATLYYDDTRDDEGRQHDNFTNPPAVETQSSTMTISKTWEGGSPDVNELLMGVMMGDEEFNEVTLSKNSDPAWTETSYISVGIIKDGKVLPGSEGHDFSFAELDSSQFHWELDAPVVHPMRIGEDIVMLVKVDGKHPAPSGATTHEINGSTYYEDTSLTGLSATNHRRSNLNLTKTVTGEDAPANATFPFTLTVKNSKAPTSEPEDDPNHDSDYWLWFSIYDTKAGATVTDAQVSASGLVGPNSDGYYYVANGGDGTAITVQMKDGWNLRFLNLPSDSTYTFTEGTLPDGFAFNKAELTQGEDSTFSGAQTTTGTIENTKTSYTVTYTNDYALTDLEITKEWDDEDNQDGIRPSAEDFAELLTLDPEVEGKTPTVVDNEDGTYTITYTGLPRFNNGEEVTYTVTEAEIEGYDTEGSPAEDHGTITNTHEPETVNITVAKEWDDDDDIGEIRPNSIDVQLFADGDELGDAETLNEGNEWTYTWEDKPKYKDGEEIEYTVDETEVPDGYTEEDPVIESDEDDNVTITLTNTYSPEPVSVDPPVQKIIENNDDLYNNGEFTFKIEAVSPEDAPMPDNTEITNSSDYELEDKEGYYEFGEIEFTKPGTYVYKVTESGDVDGVTNDEEAESGKTLTFEVTDDGTGKLVVDPTTDEVELSFTNVYDASGEGEITVTKELVGGEWPEGKELTFTLTGTGNAPMPKEDTVTLTAEGDVTFGPIEYGLEDAGETYTYTISEDGFGTDSGWTGSGDVTVTVEVTDNGDGTLTATPSYSPEDATITNTYDASGEGEITVTKELSGAEWPEGKELEFTLTGTGDAPMPEETTATLSAEGDVTFGPIEYDLDDAGETYTYTISEDGFGDGWEGSGDVTATVEVIDNGDGTLTADVSYSPDAVITNTYDATGKATLTAEKVLSGRDWKEGETFTFELQDEDGNTLDTQEVSENDSTASFEVEYGLDDVGTHTYTIAETGTLPNGVTASADISATVVVSDNGDGTLDAPVTYEDGNTITNTYEPESVKAHIDVSKTIEGYAKNEDPQYLDGKKTSADNTFEFTLYDKDGEQVGDPITITTKDGEGTASFADIEYTKTGTYTYTVKETKGDAKGITYSEKEYPVTVTVTDNTDEGKLEAEISYGEAEEGEEAPTSVEVENQFKMTSVDVELELTKTIDDQSNSAPDSTFEFTLYKDSVSDENKVDEKSIKTEKLTGSVKFDPLTFDKCGEYTYVVVEKDSGENGFTYDTEEHTYKIIVKENFEVAVLKVDEEASTLEVKIVNVYKAAATEATLKVKKEIEDTSGSAYETEFTFELSDNDGKKIDEVTVVGPNEGEFAPITYEKAGTYHYTIKETAGSAAGYQYDSKAYDVTVEVVDNEGQLEATVTYSTVSGTSQTEMTIVNTYDPQDAKITLKAKKVIEDKTGGAKGKTFTFELVNANGKVIDTVTRTGGGTVTFKEQTYSKVGTYEYTIREVAGKDKGYTYDTSEYPVSVEVTDPDKDGVLKAKITTEGEIVITNTYEAEPCVLALTANKELTGRSLKDGEFTFQLLDEDGELVAESTNDASGKIKFDDITFDAAGTYTYTVAEVAGNEDGMTYDANEYTITVKVTDEGEGVLVAEAQGDPTFKNVFEEEPPEPVPDTGDDANLLGAAMALILSALGVGGTLAVRRRRENM